MTNRPEPVLGTDERTCMARVLWTADGFDLDADPESFTTREMLPDFLAQADAVLAVVKRTINDHMQQVAHRVMDVFENADEDALADEVMRDVFSAIGLTEAFGSTNQPGANDGH